MASPNDILPLFQAISSNQAAISSNIAALTVLLYDCLLTFDIEVKYIWKSQWTIPKLLYLFAKYYGLAHLCCVLINVCHETKWGQLCAESVVDVNLTGGGTPCIRLYALYRSSKLVLVLITSLIIGIFQYHSSLAHSGEFVISKDCCLDVNLKKSLPSISTLPWNHSVFFCMMAYGCFKYTPWKMTQWFRSQDYNNSRITSSGNMLQVFIKDGTIFFFLIFSTVLMAMIIVVVQPILVAVSIPYDFILKVLFADGLLESILFLEPNLFSISEKEQMLGLKVFLPQL
ncbi:hypothetical protein GGU11DRAFT_828692 [Lentinula aff. detonsa]|nr:hypothetical protein GGU11DRAFT_828692 [Lentinula aff. detonsa]